ncbi:hypothetical protein Tco_0480244, partial [Tanacetum coccineum]
TFMVRNVTDNEIKGALFLMGDDKAPGPEALLQREKRFKAKRSVVSLLIYLGHGSSYSYASGKDDLFLFSRGHPSSVDVIMQALEDFKNVSGLVSSIPKSTTFFCNVPNGLKATILSSMPFEEGTLPIRYLGVPLISSRILYRDCKVLGEKLESLCFILPARIIHDLEQLMRGFLCCQVGDGESFFKSDLRSDSLFSVRLIMVSLLPCGLTIGMNFALFTVWMQVQGLSSMDMVPPRLADVIMFLTPISKGRSVVSVSSRMLLAATTYYLSNEHNSLLFKKKASTISQIIQVFTFGFYLGRFFKDACLPGSLAPFVLLLDGENIILVTRLNLVGVS